MSTQSITTPHLFGPGRTLPGYETDEWSVWIAGPDDIHEQPDHDTALRFAAEHNACFVDMRMRGDQHTPVMYALVLHRGHAWTRRCPDDCAIPLAAG